MNTNQIQKQSEEEKPKFVKSVNFKHSKNLVFPDELPTDRQVGYLGKLGYEGSIPTTRKEASDLIAKQLKLNELAQVNAYRRKNGLPLKELEDL